MTERESLQELENLLHLSYINDRQKEAIIRAMDALKVEEALSVLINKWKGEE